MALFKLTMHPIYAKNGNVQIRFIVKQVNETDYEEWYKHCSSWILLKKEGTLRHPIYYLLTKISDSQEFIDNYLNKNGKFICNKCKDAGVWHDENCLWHYCECEFGKLVKRKITE